MNDEELKGYIEAIRNRIEKHRDIYNKNESAVRDHLVKPIFKPLGWDTENPEEVLPEEPTEEGHPDYSFSVDNRKILLVETKNLSVDVKKINSVRQLARYAFGVGVDFGILTNGRNWLLLKAYESGTTVSERIVWEIDVIEDNIEKILVRFGTISKDNVKNLSELAKKHDILSKTWETILQSPKILVYPIAPVMKEQIIEKSNDFSLEDIKEFLSWKLIETFQHPTQVQQKEFTFKDEGDKRHVGKAGNVKLQELVTMGLLSDRDTMYFYHTRLFEGEQAQIVASSNKLKYKGRDYAASTLAAELLKKHGFKSQDDTHGVAGPLYWKTEDGKLLNDLNEQVRRRRGDRK